MKKYVFYLVIIVLVFLPLFAEHKVERIQFRKYFNDGTLRIDYYHIGNSNSEEITLDKNYKYSVWAGNKMKLLTKSKIGMYHVKIYDKKTQKLIYSNDFNSYFGEYQLSSKGLKGIKRTFHESVLIPYPKKDIIFTLEKRSTKNIIKKIFSSKINMKSLTIEKNIFDSSVKVFNVLNNGKPDKKVDIAIVAEGYKKNEIEKVKKDLNRFKKTLFSIEPYKSRKSDINIYGVFKPSVDSGCDEPSHGSFKNTVVGATFYSMGSERYLLTEDNKNLRNIAGHVPYDTLFIMVNHNRYGGGGIYNFYCTFTSDNTWNSYLILHEFGHSFAGLADEYYSSATAYNDFYPRGVEPVEPNITALLDPENIKWKNYLSDGIEIPTKWNKVEYDKKDKAYQKIRRQINNKIAQMKRDGIDKGLVKEVENESNQLSIKASKRSDEFLKNSKYAGKTGAFEGAGYSSEGLFRPMIDCIMFTKGVKPYCTVCLKAIEDKIDYYTNGDVKK